MEDWLTSCWPSDQHQFHHLPNELLQQQQQQQLYPDTSNNNFQDQNYTDDHYEVSICSLNQDDRMNAASKRREKARIAARARRSQEASIIFEMANELMISRDRMRRIDKATIVKMAIDYLKATQVLTASNYHHNQQQQSSHNNKNNHHANNHQEQNQLVKPIQSNTLVINSNCCNLYDVDNKSIITQQQQKVISCNKVLKSDRPLNNNTVLDERCKNRAEFVQNSATIIDDISDTNQEPSIPINISETKFNQVEPTCKSVPKEPILSTNSIFSPRTADMDSHYLMISERDDGKSSFVLKLESEIEEEDDLTHLAPQAGDMSIPLEVEPLDGIELDTSVGLFCSLSSSPPTKKLAPFANLRRQTQHQSSQESHHNHKQRHHQLQQQQRRQDYVVVSSSCCKLPSEVIQ